MSNFEDTSTHFDNSKYIEKFKKISCNRPFNSFHVFPDGSISNCCFYWMPTVLGNITKKTLKEIIYDQRALDAKKSVTDGSFNLCNSEICPSLVDYISNGTIEQPLLLIDEVKNIDEKNIILILDYDKSCNLFCGSCRNERILYSPEKAPIQLINVHKKLIEQLYDLLDNDYTITLQVTSSGDPFASHFYWEFLQNIKSKDNFKVRLTTNGTLMTRDRLQHPYSQKIDHIEISVDAYSAETYQMVRRGGNFNALKTNLKNLDDMICNNELPLLKHWKINFVVQTDNYKEMVDFAKWSLGYKKLNTVWFLLIYDWGHLSKTEFEHKAVWHESHPDHNNFLMVLKNPIFDDKRIQIGNLAALRKKALLL